MLSRIIKSLLKYIYFLKSFTVIYNTITIKFNQLLKLSTINIYKQSSTKSFFTFFKEPVNQKSYLDNIALVRLMYSYPGLLLNELRTVPKIIVDPIK